MIFDSISLRSLSVQAWEEEIKLTGSGADVPKFSEQKMIDIIYPDSFIVDIQEQMDIGVEVSTRKWV